MSDFEDDNPFRAETDEGGSETASNVDLSDPPSSPPSRAFSPPATLSVNNNMSHRERELPPAPPQVASHRQQIPKSDFCCATDRWLHSGEDVEIQIVDALKTSEHSTTPYIAYAIKCGRTTSYHRYSEFESFRSSMVKLYPTLIIPPIPSKQSIGEYAVKQGKAKEDASMIARRRRMLQTFLNRLAKHPILSNEHVFHRFLDGEVSWSEILHSPPISHLPKNILKAPSHNPTDSHATPAYAALPTPSATHPLRRPDQRFLDSEAFTNKFAAHVTGPMEKVTRRTVKRWSELSQDYADLGAVLNGSSLNETGPLSAALEKTGQAIDASYMSTAKLAQDLERNWSEPLHEYAQFAGIIKKLLLYRHQKHAQYEMTQETLEQKREQLEELEKSEREAQRLEEALGRGRVIPSGSRLSASSSGRIGEEGDTEDGEGHPAGVEGDDQDESPIYTLPPPTPAPSKKRTSGSGLLHALSYSLHGMMDVDPETARRNNITKTRETISQLEDALHLCAQDLKYSSSTIQADLDRFQRQKVADLKDMSLSYARTYRDWCQKNLEAWEEAKKEIDNIPEHPNHILEDEAVAEEASSPRAPRPTDRPRDGAMGV